MILVTYHTHLHMVINRVMVLRPLNIIIRYIYSCYSVSFIFLLLIYGCRLDIDPLNLPQDPAASHIQQPAPSSQYGESYQQPSTVPYRRPYNAPPSYQPVPQSNTPQPGIFVPSPVTPAPMV